MDDSLPRTEARNESLRGLDVLPSSELVRSIASDQRRAADAVVAASDALARAVDEIVARLARGGRLHYVGAGTSGRLGVLDASEMPPTFGTPPDLVCAHIAGGEPALRRAVEGAEDDGEAGASEMNGHVGANDAVVGISASGGARYVIEALRAARELGAYTVAIVNSPSARLAADAHCAIALETGAEALTGSTRLTAGTAQKIALNTLSTAVMVRSGKVYENLMVDVVATNEKLRGRAQRLVQTIAGVGAERAQSLLAAASGSVKVAVVMHARDTGAEEARRLLERERGFLRNLL